MNIDEVLKIVVNGENICDKLTKKYKNGEYLTDSEKLFLTEKLLDKLKEGKIK